VARSSAGQGLSSGGALFLWVGTVIIDLFVVLVIAHDADAGSLLFGRTGTTALLIAVVMVAIVAAVCAGRGVSGPARGILAGVQSAGAALVLVIMFGFFGGDGTKASSLSPLLLYCAFAEAMIGAAVLRSGRRTLSSAKGR
jgi:hypothetical protein